MLTDPEYSQSPGSHLQSRRALAGQDCHRPAWRRLEPRLDQTRRVAVLTGRPFETWRDLCAEPAEAAGDKNVSRRGLRDEARNEPASIARLVFHHHPRSQRMCPTDISSRLSAISASMIWSGISAVHFSSGVRQVGLQLSVAACGT
jgi:hypothetical protein